MIKDKKIDSKFRFVHVASKRAKSLLKGAKPKQKSKFKNPIRIAQQEVKEGLVDFEIISSPSGKASEKEERPFIGGDVGGETEFEAEEEIAELADLSEVEEEGGEELEREDEGEEELEEEFSDLEKIEEDED